MRGKKRGECDDDIVYIRERGGGGGGGGGGGEPFHHRSKRNNKETRIPQILGANETKTFFNFFGSFSYAKILFFYKNV